MAEEEEERKRQEEQMRTEEKAKVEREAAETVEREAAEETEEAAGATEKKELEGLKLVFPPLPTHSWVPPPEVPPERIGTGANAKVHFVIYFNVQLKIAELFYKRKKMNIVTWNLIELYSSRENFGKIFLEICFDKYIVKQACMC